ncbi:MAG: secondary thiamine-phosphate synthase enzyme YjbQ [Candidatus Omnitrophota bacterium]
MIRELTLTTRENTEFIDISARIEKEVAATDINEGLCFIYCPHTTAALTINENADPAVKKDIIEHLEELVPVIKKYSHSEGNSPAHIKASLLGSWLTVAVKNGRLLLGRWQGVYFCEFDGPRIRKVYVKILADSV